MKDYIKLNALPVIIEIAYILSCFLVPDQYYIYTNFIFYLFLLIVFIARKDFSFREWFKSLKSGKGFWKSVVLTSLLFIASFVITSVLESAFSEFDTGAIGLRCDNWFTLFIFAFSTILLPAITEETFFRKNMISFRGKGVLIITTLTGMLLYAFEHSLTVWGIFLTMIWALPLSLSYIKTKNIYVPMTAHFIGNFVGNGITVIMAAISMI